MCLRPLCDRLRPLLRPLLRLRLCCHVSATPLRLPCVYDPSATACENCCASCWERVYTAMCLRRLCYRLRPLLRPLLRLRLCCHVSATPLRLPCVYDPSATAC